MTQLAEHPTVKKFHEQRADRTDLPETQVLDAAWLLTDFSHDGATVMVAPANGFYASPLGANEVRIAYVLKEEDLRHALELLRLAIPRYNEACVTG